MLFVGPQRPNILMGHLLPPHGQGIWVSNLCQVAPKGSKGLHTYAEKQ